MITPQDTAAIRRIESSIGYTFRDKRLLVQVFTRKTYMKIDPEAPDNEVLEFYGDMLMSYHVTTYFVDKFAHMLDDGLYFMRSVEQFTEMRSHYVRNQYLTERIKELIPNIERLLRAQNPRAELAKDNQKAYADLFESMIGAVYLDSYQDEKLIRAFILRHLNIEPKPSDASTERSSRTVVLPSVSLVSAEPANADSEAPAEELVPAILPVPTETAVRPDVEEPADATVTAPAAKAEKPGKDDKPAKAETREKGEKGEKGEKTDRNEKLDKNDRPPARAGKPVKGEAEKPAPSVSTQEPATSADKEEAPVKKNETIAKVEAPTKTEAPVKSEAPATNEPPAKTEASAGEECPTEMPMPNCDALSAFCAEVGFEPPLYGETPKNAPNARPVAACTVRFRNKRGKPVKISLNDSGKTLAEATEKAAAKMLRKLKEQYAADQAQPAKPATPAEVTTEPTDEPAAAVAEKPAEVTEAPAEVAEAPAEVTMVSTEIIEAPAEASEAPAAPETDAPAEVAEAPAEVAETPAEVTMAPTEIIKAPVEAAETPVEGAEAPAEVAVVPAEVAEVPAEVTMAPTEIIKAPAEGAEAPVEAAEAPAEVTVTPTEKQSAARRRKAPAKTETSSEKKPAVKRSNKKVDASTPAEAQPATENDTAEKPVAEGSATEKPVGRGRKKTATRPTEAAPEDPVEGADAPPPAKLRRRTSAKAKKASEGEGSAE